MYKLDGKVFSIAQFVNESGDFVGPLDVDRSRFSNAEGGVRLEETLDGFVVSACRGIGKPSGEISDFSFIFKALYALFNG